MKKLISTIMTKSNPSRNRYLVDENYYRRKYLIDAEEDAFEHFVKIGFDKNYKPNPIINTQYLKEKYKVDSFLGLVQFVETTAGNPSRHFDVEFYYERYSDIREANVPAIKHFLRNGSKEGRLFSPHHSYAYNQLVEMEIVEDRDTEAYLEELNLKAGEQQSIELLPFEDVWDNSYALKIKYAIRSNKLIDRRATDPEFFNQRNVVIIGDLSIPQCKKYRVLQKVEYFRSIGVRCSFSHWLDVPRSLNLLQLASTVIFYRIPHTKLSSSYIDECCRLGITYGYDIDDPVFDLRIYSSNVNLNFISANEKQSILSGVDSYASIIRQMDFVITSTPALRDHLSDLTSKEIYIWRNIIDSETLNAVQIYQELKNDDFRSADDGKFIINYASGSRAHEADFAMAIEGLHKILKKYSNVELHIIGHCAMSSKLKSRFPRQVQYKEFTDYVGYLGEISNCDLNIIPLVQDDFNDCKSAIRFLEASMMYVPTVVTAIGDFVNLIEHGKNGLLVEQPTDWYDTLVKCITGKFDLSTISNNAHEYVTANQTIHHLEENLDVKLKALL